MSVSLENNATLTALPQVPTINSQQAGQTTEQNLECSYFDVHHFCMLLMKQLSQSEAEEITSHLTECQPCQNVYQEVQQCLAGRACPSRTEQLSFLRNMASVLWTLENEQQHEVQKRLSALETQVKELQAQLKQVLAGKGASHDAN